MHQISLPVALSTFPFGISTPVLVPPGFALGNNKIVAVKVPMNRNHRNQRPSFSPRGGRSGYEGHDSGGDGMGYGRKGLLGEPPGMGGMGGPQLSGGLGLLGSAPGQGIPGGGLPGPMGGGMNQPMFGGGGMGGGGMDQPRNQGMNQAPPNQGMNQAPPNQGMNQAPPNHGMNQAPPNHGMNQAPPNHSMNQAPPNHGMNQAPPNHGMNQAPPNHGMNQAPPNHGMNQAPPNHGMNPGMNQNMNQGMNQGMMGMQQQMAAAAMRDSQLQLVSNLIQQQGGMSSSMHGGPSPGGMMQGAQGMGRGLLGMGGRGSGGAMGMNDMDRERRHSGGPGIPSLFDISPRKSGLLGKRAININRDHESRFSNNYQMNNKRMRQNSQGQSPRSPHQIRQGQPYRQSRWSDRSPTRDGGNRDRDRDFRRPTSRDSSKYSDRSPSSRNSRDRRESESSSGKKDESEEYDPAQPTEADDELEVPPQVNEEDAVIPEVTVQVNPEEQQANDEDDEPVDEDRKSPALAKGGDSSLTVTLSETGRSVNDANTKEKTSSQAEESSPKSSHYCHACGVECRTEEGFAKHMNGKKHKVRMESLLTLHQEKSIQLEARIKAEEHLRKIEGKPRQERRSSGSDVGRFTRYQRENLRDRARKSSQEDDDEDGFPDFGDMVTVDTIGFEDDYLAEDKSDDEDTQDKDKDPSASSAQNDKLEMDPDKLTYDPNVSLGQKFIVPVSGFFCKLCHRFYNSESAARVGHCQSKSHFDQFKKALASKLLKQKIQNETKNKPINNKGPSERNAEENNGLEEMDQSACPKENKDQSACPKDENGPSVCPKEEMDQSACPKEEMDQSACPKEEMDQSACPKEEMDQSACPKEKDQSACPKEEMDRSACSKEEMDQSACPKEEIHQSDTAKSNGDIGAEVTAKHDQTEAVLAPDTCTVDIDLEAEVKLLEGSSESGSPEVQEEDSLLGGDEEMEVEQEGDLQTDTVVTTKESQRGRGGVRGKARRARRGSRN